MEFKLDASVFTAENKQIGHIDRVVLDPRSKAVTDVVVRKGLLFAEDKVVPIDLIAATMEDRVVLREDAGDLEALPDFEEKHYVLLDEKELGQPESPVKHATPIYYYPPYSVPVRHPTVSSPVGTPQEPAMVSRTERNIPEDTVALEEGADVISADGEHVGDVEKVLTDPLADRATHFVISEGLLLKEKKMIPTMWVDEVEEDQVHLVVRSSFIEGLPEYSA